MTEDYFESRSNQAYLLDRRNSTIETFDDWHNRIDEADALIRGEWWMDTPDGQRKAVQPMVMNLADAMPRDVARLTTETVPSISAHPASDSQRDIDNATLREAIAQTHWQRNNGDILVPQWAMDLVITGGAFAVAWIGENSVYPQFTRVDPRYCFPDVHNGVMQDLLVCQQMKLRIADRMFPELGIKALAAGNKTPGEFVEVWDYYFDGGYVKAVSVLGANDQPLGEGSTVIVDKVKLELGCVPAAFVQLPSADGGFRGLLDQLSTSLLTKNRAVQYVMDYTHHLVYAPWEAKGIVNADDEPGPTTIYQHDPTANESFMKRVQPAGPNPVILDMVQFLDQEERGQIGYPNARQGDVSQSIASASFVQATQGQLTSVVRDTQRLMGSLREQITYASLKLDEMVGGEKPLVRPVGKKNTYVADKDIKGQYEISVTYGAGAGLDRLNTDVRLIQFYGTGAISAHTMLENTDFISDPSAEMEMREREQQRSVILQRFASDPNTSLDFQIEVLRKQDEDGMNFMEAVYRTNEEMAAQMQAAQQQAQGIPGEEPLPQGAGAEQLALQKGEVPTEPAVAPEFAPPPLTQILIHGGN